MYVSIYMFVYMYVCGMCYMLKNKQRESYQNVEMNTVDYFKLIRRVVQVTMIIRIYFAVLAIALGIKCRNNGPIVQTSLGSIEGAYRNSTNGRPIYAFEGIPYARPPIGKHRLKDPILYTKAWQGIWIARSQYKCLQYLQYRNPDQDPVFGSEDCLYLNVYTNSLNPNANLDVIVYIHGGAFMFNHATMFGPELFLENDVVLVTVNYRLGPLGFLSTEDPDIPGNFGLKDQIVALKWIQQHIRGFGGNNNSVTITGTSAGGASVHLHYLSPRSIGLFHRGISQSGTALNPWVLMENAREKAHKLATLVGCPTNRDSKFLLKCLIQRPAEDIVRTVAEFQPWLYNPFSPFAIVVDVWATDPVLPKHPLLLLQNGLVQNLPWMSTMTQAEGLYPGGQFYNDELLKQLDTEWTQIAPFLLDFNYTVADGLHDHISGKIRQNYFEANSKIKKSTFGKLVDLIGDRMFKSDISKATRLHASKVQSEVFSYNFAYRGAHSKSEALSGTTQNMGASHSDDIAYILKMPIDTLTTPNDTQMTETMVEIFTSFAKSGKPTIPHVTWLPLSKKTSDPMDYLQIKGPNQMHMEAADNVGNEVFWKSLNLKENENIFTTTKDEL